MGTRDVGEQLDVAIETIIGLEAVIEQARLRLHAPIHPYGDRRFTQVPEHEFLADAYGEELPRDLLSILEAAATGAALREHDVKVWDEGYTTGNRHNGRRDANPYREVVTDE